MILIFGSAANRAKEMKYAFAYILELMKGGNVGALAYDMHTVHFDVFKLSTFSISQYFGIDKAT